MSTALPLRHFPRRRRRRRRRGVAFVLVLGALTLLTVMLTELQDESSADLSGALQMRDALVAEYAARSAVNLSRLLLAAEPTIREGLSPILRMVMRGEAPQVPVWEFADRVFGAFNDEAGIAEFSAFAGLDVSHAKNLGLPGASFEVRIVDEDSKINLNAPARGDTFSQVRLVAQLASLMGGPQYDPLFERRDADGNFSDRQAICSAIIDWADPDQDTTLCDPTVTSAQQMPAEDSYYELLAKPYSRKNAGFDSLEELRRVRGIGDDFWATFVDPEPDDPSRRTLTVWGAANGLNVNTASPWALLTFICGQAVENTKVCVDPLEAQKFLTVVTLARTFTAGAPPFSSPEMFIKTLRGEGMLGPLLVQLAQLEPIELRSPDDAKKQLTTESKVFSIYALGRVGSVGRETRVEIHAVVDFRGAPAPPQAPQTGTGGAPAQPPPGSGTGTGGTTLDPALQRLLAPNPAGNVVYFQVN